MTDEARTDQVPGLEARLAALEQGLQATGRSLEGHTEWMNDLQHWVSSLVRGMAMFGAQPLGGEGAGVSGAPDVLGRLLAWVEIQTVMSWIRDAAVVPEDPLVSVTLATRDRPAMLKRAIESVLGQSYRRFELIVVDDSLQPETGDLLRQVDDQRLRVVRKGEPRGAAAAFNAGLDEVRGELVVFLDDDNLMHRDWLRSVVWAFGQRPEIHALYGARILEDGGEIADARSRSLPTFEFQRYDRRRHERANFVDRNTVALRTRDADLRHDERLTAAVDWDYSLRLFARRSPLALPAIACYYGTAAPNRISDLPERDADVRTVRSRAHQGRQLRILVHLDGVESAAFAEDLRALVQAGTEVTVLARSPAPPLTDLGIVALGPEDAIAQAPFDLAVLRSTEVAADELRLLEAHEIPFVTRSVADFANPDERVREHRLWVGPIADCPDLEHALREALTGWLRARA